MFPGLLILFGFALLVLMALTTAGIVHLLRHPLRVTAGVAMARGWPTEPRDIHVDCTTDHVAYEGKQVELWRLAGQAADGPIALAVHGWADSRIPMLSWWRTLCPVVSELVMFDLPGHGESPWPVCSWGVREAPMIRAVISHLRANGRPVLLVGHSMGAAMAIEAAAGAGVAGVLADAPYFRAPRAIADTMRQSSLPAWPLADLAWACLCVRWPSLWKQNIARSATQLECPLLLLYGEEDSTTPPAIAAPIAEAACDAQYVVIPWMGHKRAWRELPEQYDQVVRDFITKVRGEVPTMPVTSKA